MSLALLIEWAIKSIVIVLIIVGGFAYLTLLERRTLARIQVRIGPNRAGPWGLLQPVADGVKLIFKEELIPRDADKVLFILAPVITVLPALIILGVIPLGPEATLFGRTYRLDLASNVNVGVLYILAVA
ncbi:MAG: NADH-quinone oxidoreductase subunit H, partial [Anaerolineales bacterium]